MRDESPDESGISFISINWLQCLFLHFWSIYLSSILHYHDLHRHIIDIDKINPKIIDHIANPSWHPSCPPIDIWPTSTYHWHRCRSERSMSLSMYVDISLSYHWCQGLTYIDMFWPTSTYHWPTSTYHCHIANPSWHPSCPPIDITSGTMTYEIVIDKIGDLHRQIAHGTRWWIFIDKSLMARAISSTRHRP